MLAIRHRSASGRLDSLWEYDPVRRTVDLVFRLGSAEPIALSVRICHFDRPELLCHPIVRVDGESWRLLPALFIPAVSVSRDRDRSTLAPRDCLRRIGLRGAVACELHDALGAADHVILTNAPAEQDRELEAIGT